MEENGEHDIEKGEKTIIKEEPIKWNSKVILSLLKQTFDNIKLNVTNCLSNTNTRKIIATVLLVILLFCLIVWITGFIVNTYFGQTTINKSCDDIQIIKSNDINIGYTNVFNSYNTKFNSYNTKFNSCSKNLTSNNNLETCAINYNSDNNMMVGMKTIAHLFVVCYVEFASLVVEFMFGLYVFGKTIETIKQEVRPKILFIIVLKIIVKQTIILISLFMQINFFEFNPYETNFLVLNNKVPTYYENNIFNCENEKNNVKCCKTNIVTSSVFAEQNILFFFIEMSIIIIVLIFTLLFKCYQWCLKKYNDEYLKIIT